MTLKRAIIKSQIYKQGPASQKSPLKQGKMLKFSLVVGQSRI